MHFTSQLALAVALFAALSIELSSAYPSGAPKCSSLLPKHAKNKAQTGKAPYKVSTSAVSKNKDGKSTVTVTISGTGDAKFKGFILYASPEASSDKIGKFTKTDKTALLTCGASVSVPFVAVNSESENLLCLQFTSTERHYSL